MTEIIKNHEKAEGTAPIKVSRKSFFFSLAKLLFHRYSLALFVAVALSMLLYLTLSEDGFIKNRGLKAERELLLKDIERLEDENHILATRLERLKNDPSYVEDEARKKLGLIRPGETVYRLSEEPDLSMPEPNKKDSAQKNSN